MSKDYRQESDAYRIARARMVETQLIPRGIHDRRVLEAMNRVPRHLFVDDALKSQAYSDHPLPISEGQTISQPYIVALMTQELGLKGHEKVLEIGTGSGYQAAILSETAGRVFSVERKSSLLARARNLFDRLGYRNILMKLDDGTHGWKAEAPFDSIIVTAAAPAVAPPLLEQLNDPGIMIIPVGDEYSQTLTKVIKREGNVETRHICGVRFVKLIGDHAWKK